MSSQTNQILHVQPMPVVGLTSEMELPPPEPGTPKFNGGFPKLLLLGLNEDRNWSARCDSVLSSACPGCGTPSSWESLLCTEATATLILTGQFRALYSTCALALLLATSLLQKQWIMENKVTQHVTYLNKQQTAMQLLEKKHKCTITQRLKSCNAFCLERRKIK